MSLASRLIPARLRARLDENARAHNEQAQAHKAQAQAHKEQTQAHKEQAQAHKEQVHAYKEQTHAYKEHTHAHKDQARTLAQGVRLAADIRKTIGLGQLEHAKAFTDTGRRLKRVTRELKRINYEVARIGERERKWSDAAINLGRLDYEPRDVFMRLDSPHAVRRTRSCEKEPWTVSWIERHVGPGDVLFDVGANVGPYALVAATAGEGRRVVALEPSAITFATLCANAVLNDVGDVLIALQIALGEETTLTTLALRDLASGSAFHVLGGGSVRHPPFEPMWSQPVLSFRLDDLLAQFALPFPSHLKIDVDGHELAVLLGAPRTLDDPRVRTVLIEIEESNADEVTETLTGHGFSLDARHQREDDAVTHWYGLFVR